MNTRNRLLCAVATALVTLGAAAAANATVTTPIDSTHLNTFGTATFSGDVHTPTAGSNPTPFSDVFNFTLTDKVDSSAQVETIEVGGNHNIDFSSVTLDGHAFIKKSGDPDEVWSLNNLVLGNGPHNITVSGNLLTGTAGSYTGSLSITAVPEPGVWGLMLLGFGGVGAMLRSNRRRGLAFA